MLSFGEFVINLSHSFTLCIITLLILSVILVNGWTDAPNAIATCVSTRCIRPKRAIIMAAIFNFLGVLVITMISSTVAETLHSIANFGDNAEHALIALCAGLVAIVLWAVLAWWFGIPTSESHALIAGVSGAAIAIQKGIGGINLNEWKKVLLGLALSVIIGFAVGFLITKLIEKICKNIDRRKTIPFFKKLQVFSGATMAFMHGAQDGQKFIGIFLLAICMSAIMQTKSNAAEIEISKTKKTLFVGAEYNLKISGTNKKITWTSSNKKVATVSSKGRIKAKKKGTTEITANVGKQKLKCAIKVKNLPRESKKTKITKNN